MARIEGEIVIGRPAGVVFDYVADQTNEPQYNPQIVRPKGAFRLLGPLITWLGTGQEQRIWAGLKQLLEAAPEAANGPTVGRL
jgi:hypothetical protein